MSSGAEILDSKVVLELRELGRSLEQDVLGEVVSAYRKLAGEVLASMAAAAAGGDRDSLARAAHTLKGASAQIGARATSEIARSIETGARAGGDLPFRALVEACRAAMLEADTALASALEERP